MTRWLLFVFAFAIPLTDASRVFLGSGSLTEGLLLLLVVAWVATLPREGFLLTPSIVLLMVTSCMAIAAWTRSAFWAPSVDSAGLDASIVRYLEYALVAWVISQLVRDERRAAAFVAGLVAGCAVEIVAVVAHWFVGPGPTVFQEWGPAWGQDYTRANFRAWGTFGNPLPLLSYLAALLGIFVVVLNSRLPARDRLVAGGMFAAVVLAMVITGSRVGLFVLIIPVLYTLRTLSLTRIIALSGLATAAGLMLASTPIGSVLIDRARELGSGDNSVTQRLAVFRSAGNMIQDHPFFGVGPSNFAEVYTESYILEGASMDPSSFTPENLFLIYSAEIGMIATLAFVAALALVLLRAFFFRVPGASEADTVRRRAVALGLVCFLAAAQVQASTDAPSSILLFSLLGYLIGTSGVTVARRDVVSFTALPAPHRKTRLMPEGTT